MTIDIGRPGHELPLTLFVNHFKSKLTVAKKKSAKTAESERKRVRVLRLVLSNALALAGIGTAIGLVAVMPSARLAAGFVYGFSQNDPVMMGAGVTCLVAVALAGSFVPAFRAARLDRARTLRAE